MLYNSKRQIGYVIIFSNSNQFSANNSNKQKFYEKKAVLLFKKTHKVLIWKLTTQCIEKFIEFSKLAMIVAILFFILQE